MKIAVTAANFSRDCEAIRSLRQAGFEVRFLSEGKFSLSTPEERVIEAVGGCDAVVAGLEPYSRRVLEALPGLKLISRCGVGYDSIDPAACRDLGVTLCRAVGAVEGAVAEHVMAYILFFARRLDLQSKAMHEGVWKKTFPRGAKGSTLGLVGFGGIGKEIALRARPFGMKILYSCRHPNPEWEERYGAEYAPLPDLLAASDYVSVNVPLTPETRGMFGAKEFAQMKENAVFINIARGAVADESALAEALKSGHLGGAGVDVFPHEPSVDSPLRACENAVLTPHTASSTTENRALMARVSAQNAIDWAAGRLNPAARVA